MLAFTFLALALVASAAAPPSVPVHVPQVTGSKNAVPFTRRIQRSTKTIPELDRARAAQLLASAKSRAAGGQLAKRQDPVPVTNQVVTYVANVGVGSPPTNYSLIIDTGSSNTWVGADLNNPYKQTSTSHFTDDVVAVPYGSGFFFGYEVTDTATLAKDLVVMSQSIGVAELAVGFDGVDGILGIGPTDLTEGTTLPSGSKVPTVTDNLSEQGTISQKVIGVYFAPTTDESDANGEMTFGGVDTSKTMGPITFTPITSTSPSDQYFGINQTITYGNDGVAVLNTTAGIVDTGTTLTLLETNAFNTYKALTGATEDQTTGLLKISPENYGNLQSLFFNIGGTTFEFTKNAQTWPRALNTFIGGGEGDIYLIIGDLGQLGGEGLDFINGMTFLERFYSVFDSTNNRVGLATTAHTFDETN